MNVKKALFASSLFLCGVGVLPVTAGLPVALTKVKFLLLCRSSKRKNGPLPVM